MEGGKSEQWEQQYSVGVPCGTRSQNLRVHTLAPLLSLFLILGSYLTSQCFNFLLYQWGNSTYLKVRL